MSGIWRNLRAVARIGAAAVYAAPILAAQIAVAGPAFKDFETFPRLLERGLIKIMGIRATFNGSARADRPVLFAANHMSYLDIILLGAHIPGSFVAKKEIRRWPVAGQAAIAVKTIFSERRVGTLRRDQQQIVEALNSGRNVILFPEGTTSDGAGLLPFKGGLLCLSFNNVSRVELNKEIFIQPVSLRVTQVDGVSVKEMPALRRKFAWVGGENVGRHFWEMAKIGGMSLEITVHEPINPADYPDRRAFAKAVEDKVRGGCCGGGRKPDMR